MAPKKAKGKGKGKGKKGKGKGISDAVDDKEKCWIFQAEIDSLQERFFEAQTRANFKKKEEQESRYRDLQLKQIQNEEQQTHKDIIADMIRQYKSTEEELTTQATLLSATIDDNKIKIE